MANIPTSYSQALELYDERRKRGILDRGVKLANNTYLDWVSKNVAPHGLEEQPCWFAVKLHHTNVVTFYSDGSIVLDSGGWKTVTTKQRMNEAIRDYHSDNSWTVWSDRGVWYVSTGNWSAGTNKQWAYEDGIILHPNGTVTGEGEDPKAQIKLRKRAKAYAKAYVDHLYSGKMPAPGNGDCFGCLMVPVDKGAGPHAGMAGPDHMLSHLEEGYYVPSLVLRALDRFGGSMAAKHDLACLFNPKQAPKREDGSLQLFGMQDQVLRMVRRHVCEQLGLGA